MPVRHKPPVAVPKAKVTYCPGGEPTEVDHILRTGICPSCNVRHRLVGWDLMRHVRP